MAKIRCYSYIKGKSWYEEIKTNKATEKQEHVDHPAHYQGKNECIDVMLAMFGVEAVKHFLYVQCLQVPLQGGQEERGGRYLKGRMV